MNNLIKKGVAVAVILLFVSVSVVPSTGTVVEKKSTTTISSGNILYVGGSGLGNYSTIQAAIDDANHGDTIFVYDDSSPYLENVIVDKSINLVGEDRNTTVINGGGSDSVICIHDYVDGVTISGFTIQNAGSDVWDDAGIEIRSSNNIITGNIIRNNIHHGIYTHEGYGAWGNTIAQNIITDNEFGIALDYSFYNDIYENYVANNDCGIFVGLSTLPSSEMLPSSSWKPFLLDEYYNNIYRNTVTNNIRWGIDIDPGYHTYVFDNNITNNGCGISLYSPFLTACIENYIYQNNIFSNKKGIEIREVWMSSAEDNEIYHNNFIGNVDHATDGGKNNKWDNGSVGNYWDNYEGIDGDEDGVGDTPYHINSLDKDRFPLMKALGIQSDPPNTPNKPSGKSSGIIPFVKYIYSTSTTDPNGDLIRYLFDWGDGIVTWTDYYSSGDTAEASHRWIGSGPYEIKVKTKDIYGYESEWSDPLSVTMPLKRQSSSLQSSSSSSSQSSMSVIPSTGNRVSFDDITPPVTTCTLDPPEPNGNNSWYVSDVEVTLNATDDMSGVNVTEYRINGGSIQTYTEPFNVTTDGEHTVQYRSIDYAGNVEDWKSADFKIDQTKPVIDLQWESPDNIHVDFTAVCSDATSGMDYVEFYLNDVLMFTDNTATYEWSVVWPPPLPSTYFVKGFIFGRRFDEQSVTFYALLVIIDEYLHEHLVYATAYDFAGNSAKDYPIVVPPPPPPIEIHLFRSLTFSNNYTGEIGFFFIDAVFEEGPL